ncbi:hypothetical protein ACE1OC_42675 (plasmid) [Streptomyces sp. DSM 116496]|uniref:hypothetical protein n=1 Tax=Streptomyces stoeckheimensis TaxID=3344656 RepID=UPI0038B3AF08
MGEQDQAEDDVAELVRPSLTGAQARVVTAGLREAVDDVRRPVAVLAHRVRDAHVARVWFALSHPSWEAYCAGEFGISCAQAYRLLEVARGLGAIQAAVTAGTPVARTRDSPPVAVAALDYRLSQRALIAVAARRGDITERITGRLAALTRDGAQDLDAPTVRAVVHQAVPADTGVAELRRVVDDLAASALTRGELFLEVAPAYLSYGAAADVLGPLCDVIGEYLDTGLSARRYALTGDRRALHGAVL